MNGLARLDRWIRADSANTVQFLRVLLYLWPTTTLGVALTAYLRLDQERIGPVTFWILMVASIPMGLVASLLCWWAVSRASTGFAQMVSGSGNIRPAASFSLEESMIVRGEFLSARSLLEARHGQGPDDVEVALRLAELHARWIKDPVTAERWYQAARRGGGDDRQRAATSNGLIDLYRASGQTGRLMVELARFAQAYPHSRAGQEARRELQELKRELG